MGRAVVRPVAARRPVVTTHRGYAHRPPVTVRRANLAA